MSLDMEGLYPKEARAKTFISFGTKCDKIDFMKQDYEY